MEVVRNVLRMNLFSRMEHARNALKISPCTFCYLVSHVQETPHYSEIRVVPHVQVKPHSSTTRQDNVNRVGRDMSISLNHTFV